MDELRNELKVLLNKHSRENASDTPDHILARYMESCLMAFEEATRARDKWWRFDPWRMVYERSGVVYNRDAGGFAPAVYTGPTPPTLDDATGEGEE